MVTSTPAATLALALGLGILISVLCARVRIPAVLPLMVAGVLVGPYGLGLVDGDSLGRALGGFITVAIGLLIFEGGLHLNRAELTRAPRAVRGLLTVGALATWGASALAAKMLLGLEWEIALILGAILIVTGPTVVQPILRRVALTPRLHAVLTAEATLIDPLGVIATVVTLEIVLGHVGAASAEFRWSWLVHFALPLVAGAAIGAIAGLVTLAFVGGAAAKGAVSERGAVLVCLGACAVAVGLSELVLKESGLMASAVCGLVLARARGVWLRDVQHSMEEVAGVLVGTLFILLASRIDLASLRGLGWEYGAFVAAVVVLVRPLCVAVGVFRSKLTIRERTLLAFMAPRGIVAVSVASIAALELTRVARELGQNGGVGPPLLAHVANLSEQAERLETAALLVVVATVALGGVLAGPMASLLGVRAGPPSGVLIAGANALARAIGKALADQGNSVVLIDRNPAHVALAKKAGLNAVLGDVLDAREVEETILDPTIGWVISATGNSFVDSAVVRWGLGRFGDGHAALWSSDGAGPALPALSEKVRLDEINRHIEGKRWRATTWTGPAPVGAIPVAMIGGGPFRLTSSAGEPASPNQKWLGLTPAPAPENGGA